MVSSLSFYADLALKAVHVLSNDRMRS